MDAAFVEMTHPETGGVAEFAAGAVEHWRGRGWVPTIELEAASSDESSLSDDQRAAPATDPKQATNKDKAAKSRAETLGE